jgi:hypothetical protein
MGEVFTVTRGARSRAAGPVITLVLIGLLVAYLVAQTARMAWQNSTQLSTAPADEATFLILSWVLMAGLVVVLLRLLAPFWQLVSASGTPADVVLAVDATGLRMADSGCEITAPWSSLEAVDVHAASSTGYRLHVVATGPVQVSHDPLGRVMGRRLRHGGVNLRFTPDSPSRAELVAAIAHHSGGRFATAPRVPAPRSGQDASISQVA